MAFHGKYWIQKRLDENDYPLHAHIGKLWVKRWKPLATKRVYPFMFGHVDDFDPIFKKLKWLERPIDWTQWAEAFSKTAWELTGKATAEEQRGNRREASELYLRASAVWRIARFPIPRTPKQVSAWENGKTTCLRGLSLRPHPVLEVMIPFVDGRAGEGDVIPAYYLVPQEPNLMHIPLVIIFSGLDGLRTELAVWMEGFREIGVATLVVEIPGTGDCPVDARDPRGPDRLYTSIFRWLNSQLIIDPHRIAVWGFSTGGYYAIRVAHTHHDKLAGVVALGGGCHHMFDEEWLQRCDLMEYPFDCAHCLAWKWGYKDDLPLFMEEGQKRFSLLEDGTLDRPNCAKLLLVNGMEDEVFPIDDYFLALQHGAPKEARLVPGRLHMGEPESFAICLEWLYRVLWIPQGDVKRQLQTLTKTPDFGESTSNLESVTDGSTNGPVSSATLPARPMTISPAGSVEVGGSAGVSDTGSTTGSGVGELEGSTKGSGSRAISSAASGGDANSGTDSSGAAATVVVKVEPDQ